ncbi:MAG: hypothetical protein IH618_01615, partial [Ignavibacteriaceae bacterium]|nr:hypothetical protein [Ignavibacteriaceae bacterium]
MKSFKTFSFCFLLVFTASIFGQYKPQTSFENLMISAEKDFQQVLEARNLAETYDLPHTIYLPEGVFIEAKGIENNQVVYSIVNDLLQPFKNGEVAFWEEIDARFDLSEARVHWSNKPTQNPTLGYNFVEQENMAVSFVMGPESTTDAVMSFNYNDGSLINAAYIPGGNPNLSTPIEALLTPNATILVSDQLTDNIVEFDTLGAFVRILFGGNTAVLDNCRGIELRPGDTSVVAAIAGGANQDAFAEFSLTTGNYIGNFIAPNATQMDGPWDIIFRETDCLVTGQASNDVTRYDLNGNYLGVFVPTIAFPEQINKTLTSNIIVGNFSSPSGLYIYDANGNQLNYFSTIAGLRGCFQLGNGNYLVTNGNGAFVLDRNTGALVSTPIAGVSGRSLREYELSSTSTTFQLSVNVADGWNMVSIPGLHPVDQNVNTWWAFRDPGANVFKYAGGYQPVTDAAPGIGYWMKHSGALTYNTGEEWPAGGINIVPHDPLTAASGWNLFGGYELSVTAANVTTNPPGLQNGPIYKYSGGYSVATTLDPGYGYWIKLDAAGQIIIPETMAKGEAVEYFPEEWGRIVLTDATGINYTLYAVKGEVNLDNYELPPAPPTGMFDIRYSSGRIAEDINGSVKTIDMSGVTYPLTVRVEGMDIR